MRHLIGCTTGGRVRSKNAHAMVEGLRRAQQAAAAAAAGIGGSTARFEARLGPVRRRPRLPADPGSCQLHEQAHQQTQKKGKLTGLEELLGGARNHVLAELGQGLRGIGHGQQQRWCQVRCQAGARGAWQQVRGIGCCRRWLRVSAGPGRSSSPVDKGSRLCRLRGSLCLLDLLAQTQRRLCLLTINVENND